MIFKYFFPQNQHNVRPNGLDNIRKIVQEEGRTARNLVQYNVPVLENQSEGPNNSGNKFDMKAVCFQNIQNDALTYTDSF